MAPYSQSSQTPSTYGGEGPTILGISISEFVVATWLVGLRVYLARIKVIPKAGWTLYWTCASWFVGTVSQVFLIIGAGYGIGNHAAILARHGSLSTALMWAWLGQIIGLFGIGLGKVAVVNFLLFVQGPTYRKKRIFLIALATLNVAIDTACLLEIIFHCSPPRALWDPSAGICHNPKGNTALGYFTGSFNAATDLVLAFYPILLFWDLQVSNLVKFGLCSLLGLGAFAAVCSAIKTWQVHVINSTKDPSYDLSSLLIWAWTEMWIVLILTSVAPLWPVIKRAYERLFTVISHHSHHHHNDPPRERITAPSPHNSSKKQSSFLVGRNQDFLELGELPDDKYLIAKDVGLFRDDGS